MSTDWPANARERDARVTERVMGWTKTSVGDWWETSHGFLAVYDFCPSECIADAWLVVDEMRRRGIFIEVWAQVDGYRCGAWRTKPEVAGYYRIIDDVTCETAAEGICLVALAALAALGER